MTATAKSKYGSMSGELASGCAPSSWPSSLSGIRLSRPWGMLVLSGGSVAVNGMRSDCGSTAPDRSSPRSKKCYGETNDACPSDPPSLDRHDSRPQENLGDQRVENCHPGDHRTHSKCFQYGRRRVQRCGLRRTIVSGGVSAQCSKGWYVPWRSGTWVLQEDVCVGRGGRKMAHDAGPVQAPAWGRDLGQLERRS